MIRIYSFNENWKHFFQKEKAILTEALFDQKFTAIEHIGATSVVLSLTAGTIDVLLSIPSKIEFFTIKNVLVRRGYTFIERRSNNDMMFFVRKDENGNIVATIRLVEYASDLYNKIKLFKFFLKEKNEHVFKYNDFRKVLAIQSQGDFKKYEDGKAAYIASILERHCDIK